MDESAFIEAFPRVIDDLLKKNGLSGNELAARSGVSQPQISRVLKGTRKISLEQVAKVAGAFGLTGAELMRLAEEEATRANLEAASYAATAEAKLRRFLQGDYTAAAKNTESTHTPTSAKKTKRQPPNHGAGIHRRS
ncbi:helix-turn-helix transcriptional regulator [Trueperella pyogenes]|uniref:helix-turn-helix domain-containing protein n=1 Tax=Trueperella pyogenes TaxID=1661 RepID=UPI001432D6E0|nr:helix-turn-helix transcriptional regulator [Trueperella pyogenes]QIU87099.1 helix-turn-helix transcriptional regulator [Trueperella pyogenes]